MLKRSYLCTILLLLAILMPGFCLDYLYYHSEIWLSETTWFGHICNYFRQIGFSYTNAFGILKSNFGILVTAISVIISISVNISNRSENRAFGLKRNLLLDVSKRTLAYQYGRKMVFMAPIVMILVINLQCCITGY